jgi:hypothetical protein
VLPASSCTLGDLSSTVVMTCQPVLGSTAGRCWLHPEFRLHLLRWDAARHHALQPAAHQHDTQAHSQTL